MPSLQGYGLIGAPQYFAFVALLIVRTATINLIKMPSFSYTWKWQLKFDVKAEKDKIVQKLKGASSGNSSFPQEDKGRYRCLSVFCVPLHPFPPPSYRTDLLVKVPLLKPKSDTSEQSRKKK